MLCYRQGEGDLWETRGGLEDHSQLRDQFGSGLSANGIGPEAGAKPAAPGMAKLFGEGGTMLLALFSPQPLFDHDDSLIFVVV